MADTRGVSYAGFGVRAASWAVDGFACVLVGLAVAFVGLVVYQATEVLGGLLIVASPVASMVAMFYFSMVQGLTGASPGKRLLGLRVEILDASEGTWKRGSIRLVAHLLDVAPLYLGWFLPLIDRRRQTLADKVLRTVVVVAAPRDRLGLALFLPPNRQ